MSIKGELRKQLRDALTHLSQDAIRDRSILACNKLIEQPEYRAAEIVMVFLSMQHEINTSSLVLQAWRDRKRVLAPRVSWEQRRMIPVEIRSLNEDIEETQWNVRQPTQGQPIPVDMIDLVIVPGLGFDDRGNRLGRGRGFYDRFLVHPAFHATTCALAFDEQCVSEIPSLEHDIRVDMLVTDTTVHRFSSSPAGTR